MAFTEDERLIGEAAKNQATTNLSLTLFDVDRRSSVSIVEYVMVHESEASGEAKEE